MYAVSLVSRFDIIGDTKAIGESGLRLFRKEGIDVEGALNPACSRLKIFVNILEI
jgi:hypothetical protein